MQAKSITIPSQFYHPLFFDDKIISYHAENMNDFSTYVLTIRNNFFLYDMLEIKSTDKNYLRPWLFTEKAIAPLLNEWQVERNELFLLFKERSNNELIKRKMSLAISFFFSFLFWSNNQPISSIINWFKDLSSIQMKPINVKDRMQFILQKPEQYHSFRQLDQLFQELTKQYYKKITLENKIK